MLEELLNEKRVVSGAVLLSEDLAGTLLSHLLRVYTSLKRKAGKGYNLREGRLFHLT